MFKLFETPKRAEAATPVTPAAVPAATELPDIKTAYLAKSELTALRLNWIEPEPRAPIRVSARTRYSQREAAATVTPNGDGTARVVFDVPQRAVTAGQAVVFYEGERVLGGGTIQ